VIVVRYDQRSDYATQEAPRQQGRGGE